ncbi:MAG: hypothetical protein J1F35_02690 [Erysipelotrichales bacterium]|nr:hypothetical protein [Erysipelotrichales bacterium]
MILRKPYAFIIRHFRMIHLMMLACLAYLLILARDINKLFTTLQSTSTYIYAGADVYINHNVYYIILILLFLCGVVYWLLREKKKPTKLYLFLFIYGIILGVLFYYEFNLLATLQENVIEADQLILGRDISLIASLPNYAFIVICFIRGIGFNLKQFNFSKDIEELEIADKDSAEFEVLIGQNNYIYFRFIRRTIREIKYYILENKIAISIFCGILILFFSGYGIYYYNQYMKKMAASESTSVDNIAYTVKGSYMTSHDFNGNVINERYKYVVVDMIFYNSSTETKTLDLDKISLADGTLSYQPTLTKNQKFYDLGEPYNEGDIILSGESKNATLTFEIPASVTTRNFALRVQYGLDTSGKKIMSRYRNFDIHPKQIDEKHKSTKMNINETINTNVISKNEFNLTITGYQILDSFDNRYVVCQNINNCLPLSNIIKPSRISSETMLVIDYRGTMYDDAIFTRTFNTYNKVFENYCTVSYEVFNKGYSIKANVVANSDVDGKIFVVMDRKLMSASEITLYFNFRDTTYEIPLLSNLLT